jgi:MoxR-like ATPase
MTLEEMHERLAAARAAIGEVVIGQREAIDRALVVTLCGQHGLFEGVPGVAKTLLAKTMAAVTGGSFQRVQFTPDLMPADITGTNVFNLQRNEFTLAPGPVFTSFLVADEINRAPAKTQSALLQAMQERQVTIDRETYRLPGEFTVFATQNPIEHEGTYPLAEAQKDRFQLKIEIGYLDRAEEVELARQQLRGDTPEQRLERGAVRPVLAGGQLMELRTALRQVQMREELVGYVVELVRRTRTAETLLTGAGPRGTQALLGAARAQAALEGRDFVAPDDVKMMAVAALGHRLVMRPEFEIEGMTAAEVVRKILAEVAVPV